MSVKAQTVTVHLLHNDGVNRGLRKGGEPGLIVRVGSPHNKSAGRKAQGTGAGWEPSSIHIVTIARTAYRNVSIWVDEGSHPYLVPFVPRTYCVGIQPVRSARARRPSAIHGPRHRCAVSGLLRSNLLKTHQNFTKNADFIKCWKTL